MKFRIILLLVSLLSCAQSSSQHLGYLGIEDGLSNNTVNSIYKDSFGFMWFGTDDGLNQYDGYSFKVYRNRINDTTSLIHNQITTFTEDQHNNLWIGTKKGLCAFKNNASVFSHAYYIPSEQQERQKIQAPIPGIVIDSKGIVCVATEGLGLLIGSQANTIFRQVPLSLASGDFSTNYNANAVQADSAGRLWVIVQSVGLCLYNQHKDQLELVSNTVRSANTIKAGANTLWVGTEQGLYRYNIAANSYKYYGEGISRGYNSRVLDISYINDNTLGIATDGDGIYMLDIYTDRMSSYLPAPGENNLTSSAVSVLFKDSDARWWIGTYRGGINIIDQQKDKFRTVAHNPLSRNSLINNFAFSFCEDSDQSIWIGTDGGGISLWSRQQNTFRHFKSRDDDSTSLSNNNVTSIIRDHENTIWVATYGGGINKYDRATGNFIRYTCGYDNSVWKLYEDREKNLWAGTCLNGSLYKYNRVSDQFEVYDPKLQNIITIAEDKGGTLWLGNFSQLIKVDKATKKHRIFTVGHPVRAIHQDQADNFWIGTQGLGLLRHDSSTGKFTAFSESEGLSNNSVHNIEEDAYGNFWISTYNGLSKFDPVNKEFKNFYETDGLQSNQFNYNASLRLSSGELIFGGIKGFNIFHPDSIKPTGSFPKLVITGVRLLNKALISEDGVSVSGSDLYHLSDITLPYTKTYISFDFSALEYTSPKKIKYAYFLDGWDKSWNYVDNLRTANYSKLEEGDYLLRIKSTNAEGVWNKAELQVNLTVLPPWYRTWWAYCIYSGFILGVLYLYNRYHSKQAHLKYEVKIAHVKAEKEAELNEKKLSFFTNISHEFRTPLTLIINPIKELVDKKRDNVDYQDLSVIYRNARRLLSLVDQLLLFRKAGSGEDKLKFGRLNLAKVCEEVFLSFSHQAKAKDITYSLVCENSNLELCADREKIEIALFNLLSNAFKFTPAKGKITLDIRDQGHQLEIIVEDTGCGIPADTGTKLFDKFHQVHSPGSATGAGFGIGLYLVKQFVEAHSGNITYQSALDRGTRFRIELPKQPIQPVSVADIELSAEGSSFLEELMENLTPEGDAVSLDEQVPQADLERLVFENRTMLLVEDNVQIRDYLKQIFAGSFTIYEADNGEAGFTLAQEHLPDIVISDVLMQGMSGLEMCRKIKENAALNHVPVILLTASSSPEVKLKGIEGGADDYITKPFEKEFLTARVANILQSRNNLQKFFYNEITLKTNNLKISAEYSDFLTVCIDTIESHLDDPDFSIKTLAREMGVSHSNLYKKVKFISGRSVNDFVRFIRLRKTAKLLINTDYKINEAAFQAGFNDIKYFREQFCKLFGMNPSEYIKKYRRPFGKRYNLNEKVLKETVE